MTMHFDPDEPVNEHTENVRRMKEDGDTLIFGVNFWNSTSTSSQTAFYAEWNEWRIKRGLPIVYPPGKEPSFEDQIKALAHAMGISEEEVRQRLLTDRSGNEPILGEDQRQEENND